VEVENNSLAHVLAAAEKEKPGTIAKYQAAREAMCQQDPEACRQAVNEADWICASHRGYQRISRS
jgi:filamentous hemagglutinin